MSFLRRKENNLIPPVDDAPAHRDPPRTNYQRESPSMPPRSSSGGSIPSRYTRGLDKSDVYSRGERDLDQDRQELFSGYNRDAPRGPNRFRDDGPTPNLDDDLPTGENEEDDVEAIKTKSRFTKQESVNSTRNALRIAREAEETARNTLLKLGDQSEKIANTERHLDVAKGHSNRAEDKTDELKQLNRSIFRPVITFNKDAKRRAQELKHQARYEEDRDERERSMADIRDSQTRVGGAIGPADEGDSGQSARSRFKSAEAQATRKEQRKRYQFEATASDDEIEDEIDDNLDEIGDAAKRLQRLGLAMGQEIDTQMDRLNRIDGKVGRLDQKLYTNTQKLNRIK